jgi:DNA-binding winged helix-turn-helix (wHTH) protein
MKNNEAGNLARSRLVIGSLHIDIGLMRVAHADQTRRLTPKALAVLLELARVPQQTVSRVELLDRVWADSEPTPDVLSYAVKELRRALGDSARAPSVIQTVHGLGYRLMQPVRWEEQIDEEPSSQAPTGADNDAEMRADTGPSTPTPPARRHGIP